MRKFLAVLLCLCTLCVNVSFGASAQKSDALVISTTEEFLTFAENCRLDSFSRDLTVELIADINLSGTDFSSVPSFSGIFNGNGHTIYGAVIKEEGSVRGFFRYLTDEAIVKDLNISASVLPEGSRSVVGGIAGSNSGSILGCSFSGTVSGIDEVGGIAGVNTENGVIKNCRAEGTISGSHFVGGIAGKNEGTIYECRNYAQVNTTVQQNSVELSDITLDSLTNSESASTVTDIGGIAGGNTGVIRSCENRANIGYKHMGYNIGGIAGSQSGYIFDCTNTGSISGRKEVGGIVGQLEPTTVIKFSEDTLQILQEQLNTAGYLINNAAAHAQGSIDEMGAQLQELQNQSENAQNALEVMLGSIGGADGPNFDAILNAQNTLSSSVSEMVGIMQGMGESAGESMAALNDELESIGNQLNAAGSTMNNAGENLGASISDVSDIDTSADISSKIEKCTNIGKIIADINAGGITGSVSIENDLDHEEDIIISGEQSANVDTMLRAVILSCENTGTVTVKKQNAGGIVGWMSMGLVKECINTGYMECDGADYIGGVAGQSTAGFIRRCSAKCSISGGEYIGGIAGSGKTVSDSRSMIHLAAGAEKIGAVIGYAEERSEIVGNYYWSVGKDLGGIDGISYDGCAQPLDDVFFELEGISEVFKTVTLSFVCEDGSVRTVAVETGGAVSEDKIPALPEKEGYIARWQGLEDIELSNVRFDAVFYAEYSLKNAVTESYETRADGRPILLAQGTAERDGGIILANITDEVTLASEQTVLEGWKYELGEISRVQTLRFLPEKTYSKEDIAVFVRDESGEWVNAEFIINGSYVVFNTDKLKGEFCIAEALPDYSKLIKLGAGALIVVVLIVILLCRRASKKKKEKNTEE